MTIFVCVNTDEAQLMPFVKLKYNTMKWMCRAQDTADRSRQSRLPAFDAGAMNKEKGRHSMPHNERCESPIISGETSKKEAAIS